MATVTKPENLDFASFRVLRIWTFQGLGLRFKDCSQLPSLRIWMFQGLGLRFKDLGFKGQYKGI